MVYIYLVDFLREPTDGENFKVNINPFYKKRRKESCLMPFCGAESSELGHVERSVHKREYSTGWLVLVMATKPF